VDPFFVLPFLFSGSDVSNLLSVGASALAIETLKCDFHAGVHS
jgi:hypothetical protein